MVFNNSPVFVMSSHNDIYRLEIDKKTQKAICETLSDSVETMFSDKNSIEFDGSYKPEDDECLKIDYFQLPDEIKDAIRNPLGVTAYEKDPEVKDGDEEDFLGYPEIKAIFVGERTEADDNEHFKIAFQKYRREQNIVTLPFRLFWNKNTFRQNKHFGIGITYNVDCYFINGELQFNSFFFARQIFDLSGYYRSATDKEVEAFTKNEKLDFENAEVFQGIANSYVRRKIAMINDSGVLNEYTAIQIKSLANTMGIEIKVKNKKIIIPEEKEDALLIVGFLDEEAYRGPFTNNLLLANSKRIVKKVQKQT